MALTSSPPSSLLYRPAKWPSVLYAVGMVSVFLGERLLDSGRPQNIAGILGIVLLLVAIGVRLGRQAKLPEAHRAPERTLIALYLVGLFGVVLYFLNSDLLLRLSGKSLEQRVPRVAGALGALWPALWLAGTLPVLFVELAAASMAKAPLLEVGRIRAALLSGLGIAFALVFCFAVTYVATERNKNADFSYFRTSRPGESTKKIVAALDKPVQIHLFFPPGNEVREEVEGYFSELARLTKFLEVQRWDHAIHPAKARDLGVSGNGIIVIARDALKEQIGMPIEIDRARGQLKGLDGDVQKRLLGVTRKQKVAYFTVGHEERSPDAAGAHDLRGTVRTLKSILVDQNFEPKDLGLAQGLAREIPADASMVMILGPQKAFEPMELAALNRYLDRNGRLLIALDPEAGLTMSELLAPLSLKYEPVTLANDKYFMRANYQESDHVNIGAATFSSHVSITTNTRFGARAAILLMGSGSLSKQEKTAAGIVNLDFTVRTDGDTWGDRNGNFKFDEGAEVRTAHDVVAAVTKRNASAIAPEEEARVVVMADSDLLTDRALRNLGNGYILLDVIRWLGGEERFTGQVSNEEDVPIEHSRKQDLVWFYLSIFAAPALVLAGGFFATRKRRSARRGDQAPPPGPVPATEVPR